MNHHSSNHVHLTRTVRALALLAALSTLNHPLSAAPLGTAFTYQGKLADGANAAGGSYDLKFTLYDAATNGSLLAGPITNSAVGVSNGLFTVALDFGAGPFYGDARWLEIGVRTNGSPGGFTTLTPLQPLTPTPYAIYAPSTGLANSVAVGSISNAALAPGAVDASRIAAGGIAASNLSPALLSNTFWSLTGNAGTAPPANFVGTRDNQALEFWVNSRRAMRLEPTASSVNVIGGHASNMVVAAEAVTIAGGGGENLPNMVFLADDSTIGGGEGNQIGIYASQSTIAGGFNNTILSAGGAIGGGYGNHLGYDASASTIVGGSQNQIEEASSIVGGGELNTIAAGSDHSVLTGGKQNSIGTGSPYSFLGGGSGNLISTNAPSCTIAGGSGNQIQGLPDTGGDPSGSFIGGGLGNVIGFAAYVASISGGNQNVVSSGANQASVGGGQSNTIGTNATCGTIGGGCNNSISAGAGYATIPGGYNNVAGQSYAFAAGHRAKAIYQGDFVWADSQEADFSSAANDQFLIRAQGGVGINKTNPATALDVNGTVTATGFSGNGAGLASVNAATLNGQSSSAFAPASDSANYIQNQNAGAQTANLWISGSASAGSFTGSGAGLTALNATNLASGTVADARLSTNVPLLAANQTFTGTNTFTKPVGIGTTASFALDILAAQAVGRFISTNNAAGGSVIELRNNTASSITLGAINFNDSGSTYPGQIAFYATNAMGFRVAGGTNIMLLNTNGLYVKGVLVSASDRNAKENFDAVDPRQVLDKVTSLPLTTWNFKTQDNGVRHLGPMAQDFKAAFGLGDTDTGITTVDADGVALAAIQGLNEKVESGKQKAESRMERLEAENAELRARLEKLERLLEARTR